MNAHVDMGDMVSTAQSSGQDQRSTAYKRMGTQVVEAQRCTLWCCGAIKDSVVGMRQP